VVKPSVTEAAEAVHSLEEVAQVAGELVQNEEVVHPAWPEEGNHLWGDWSPYNKTQEYAQCVNPKCHAFVVRDVPRGA
jgi:hypothetical protein